MQRLRDNFIDSIKIYACILVVLGHFFQSMTAAMIIPQTALTEWFEQTIYYFHVPLFFICSGYLYQKYSKVLTFTDWTNNVLKKAISLSIPYFVFSTITWVLKTVFSSSVNGKADGFFVSMFLDPISPYWYLYALFFVFLITPTIRSKKIATIFLVVALGLKIASFMPMEPDVFALRTVMQNEIWFVMGMCLCFYELPKQLLNRSFKALAVVFSVVFVVLSVFLSIYEIDYSYVAFVMGVIACASTVIFAVNCENNTTIKKINLKCAKYTLPVFLMHTIFAAGFRAVLLKLGVTSSIVHIVTGIAISFIGPIIATIIMSKVKWLDFLLYPGKYLKIKPRGNV